MVLYWLCALVVWTYSVIAGANLADGIFRIGTDKNQTWGLARSAPTPPLLVILISAWYLYMGLIGYFDWQWVGAILISIVAVFGWAYSVKRLLNRRQSTKNEETDRR